jgi:hypothetical protein
MLGIGIRRIRKQLLGTK